MGQSLSFYKNVHWLATKVLLLWKKKNQGYRQAWNAISNLRIYTLSKQTDKYLANYDEMW